MTTELEFTGERFIPTASGIGADTRLEHLLRYRSVVSLCSQKLVLDAACGEGYGTHLISSVAEQAIGIDQSEEVIVYATNRYQAQNLIFNKGSVTELPYSDSQFDCVVSFETLEHLNHIDQNRFLEEVRRVLKPSGLLVISTPNRLNYSKLSGQENPHHLCELTKPEFLKKLEKYLIHAIYSQSTMAFSAIWNSEATHYPLLSALPPDPVDEVFMIVVCGRELSQPPRSSLASLAYDPGLSFNKLRLTLQSKEEHILKVSNWATEINASLAESSAELNSVRSDLEGRTLWAKSLQEQSDQQGARIITLQEEVATLSERGTKSNQELDLARAAIDSLTAERDLSAKWANSLQKQNEQNENRIAQLQREVAELSTWGSNLNAELELGKTIVDSLNDEVKNRTRSALSNEEIIRRRDERINKLQTEVEELSNWATQSGTNLSIAQLTIDSLNDELENRTDGAKSIERQSEARATRVLQLQVEVEDLSAWGRRLDNELIAAHDNNQALVAEIQERERLRHATECESEKLRNEIIVIKKQKDSIEKTSIDAIVENQRLLKEFRLLEGRVLSAESFRTKITTRYSFLPRAIFSFLFD